MTLPEFTVHAIDDDAPMRALLTAIVKTAGLPVRSYASAADFLAILPDLAPGCIVTDINMPGMSGLQLQQKLNQLGIAHPLIVVTGQATVSAAIEALKGGAADFIEKPILPETLLASIQTARAVFETRQDAAAVAAEVDARLNTLTPREHEVLKFLLDGESNKLTAFNLGVSQRTVEVHRGRIMDKMKVKTLAALVRLVLKSGQPLP